MSRNFYYKYYSTATTTSLIHPPYSYHWCKEENLYITCDADCENCERLGRQKTKTDEEDIL